MDGVSRWILVINFWSFLNLLRIGGECGGGYGGVHCAGVAASEVERR